MLDGKKTKTKSEISNNKEDELDFCEAPKVTLKEIP